MTLGGCALQSEQRWGTPKSGRWGRGSACTSCRAARRCCAPPHPSRASSGRRTAQCLVRPIAECDGLSQQWDVCDLPISAQEERPLIPCLLGLYDLLAAVAQAWRSTRARGVAWSTSTTGRPRMTSQWQPAQRSMLTRCAARASSLHVAQQKQPIALAHDTADRHTHDQTRKLRSSSPHWKLSPCRA